MNTNNLMTQAKKIMSTYACRDLAGDERENMRRKVDEFFTEHVSKLDKSEIMAHMTTPMKALRWFHNYVCESFRRRCCATEMPAEADTCRLNG